MAKIIRKVLGALFIISALILTQIPMPEAFAANAVEDFQKDRDTLVQYTGTATAVSVPDTVKKIGEEAFAQNEDIGSVNVGKNVTEIASSAFTGCKYLTSVTVPDNVISIGDYVFSGCEYLSKVKIGESVEKIGSGVFAGCNSLSSVEIDEDNENFLVEKGVLYNAKKENLISYLNGYSSDTYNMPDSVKNIEPYSFWGNETLEYIHLSSYLEEIPGYAFSNCKNLKNITIPYSVDSIDAKAFENCVSLSDVTIPASVKYIDSTAFDGCRKLNIIADKGTAGYEFYQEYLSRSKAEETEKEDIIVPGTSYDASKEDGIASNDASIKNAANDPSNVDYMPSSDPLATQDDDSVKAKTLVVGGNAILFMDSAEAVVYGGKQENTNTFESNFASNNTQIVKPQDESVRTPSQIVYEQTKGGYLPKYAVLENKIATQGFYADDTLSSYTIPNGVETIGDFAFARSSLETVVIPDGVTSIGFGAFYHCDNLSQVSIPSSVQTIEDYAFMNTPYLNSFLESGDSPYLVVGDNILLAYKGSGSEVIIPEGIKQIAPGCFSNHSEIKSLRLPDSLQIVGEDAFNGCSNLRNVSGGSNVTEIRDRAFMNCPLDNFVLPASIEKIGLRAIDFSQTDKTEETKVVVLAASDPPQIYVGKDSKRLSNVSFRDDALKGVNIVVVPTDCDNYKGTVLDSSLPGFSGFIVTLDESSRMAKVKECLASSSEALAALPKSFMINNITYMIPDDDYKLSANRHYGVTGRNVTVEYNSERTDNISAVFAGDETVGILAIDSDVNAEKRIQAAYSELFGGSIPDMAGFSIKLTDETGYIPITKFGKEELTITMPIPETIKGNRYRVVCLDEDGQLEEADSVTEGDRIRFKTTHLSDYAIYATGDEAVSLSLENGKLVKNYKKDASPDTGDNSLPVNYVFALGISLIGIILILYRRKKI